MPPVEVPYRADAPEAEMVAVPVGAAKLKRPLRSLSWVRESAPPDAPMISRRTFTPARGTSVPLMLTVAVPVTVREAARRSMPGEAGMTEPSAPTVIIV